MRIPVWMAAFALASAVCFSGCGHRKAQEASGAAAQNSSSGAEALQENGTANPEAAGDNKGSGSPEEVSVKGVVIDATMNTLILQTDAGKMLTVPIGETAKEKPDLSGLKDGAVPGRAAALWGRFEGDSFVLRRATDLEAKCKDRDALEKAGLVMMSVRDQNLKALAGYASFPLYVGIGGGREVTTEEEFLESYRAEQIFTKELVQSVLGTNLMEIEEADGSMVISRDGGTPNIVISLSDDGWGVTGINLK